jgi:ribosomal protein S14
MSVMTLYTRSLREPGGSVLYCERCGRVMAVPLAFHLCRYLPRQTAR